MDSAGPFGVHGVDSGGTAVNSFAMMAAGTALADALAMSPFRNATELVEAEVAGLEAAHRRVLASLPAGHRSLFVRRTARISAGVAGSVAAAVVVVAMLARMGGYSRLLLAGWGAVATAYVVAARAASLVLRRRLRRVIMRTSDPFRDHAALGGVDLAGIESELAGRRVHASYAWPLIAISLLGPPTLHLLAGLALHASLRDLDEWLLPTSELSVHVYAYAVVAAWRFPRTRRPWRPLLWATVLSLVPGVLCLGVSTMIVGVTATVIVFVGYLPIDALMTRDAQPPL